MKNKFEKKYKKILSKILLTGDLQKSRNGNTSTITDVKIKHNLNNGFPIITGRKILLKNFIYELIWFLNGETNIKYLKDNNVNIWDLWADNAGDLGKVYGYQLRKYNSYYDQLNNILNELKNNKYSRRHVISLWNPCELTEMALPPCYHSFQFNYYKNKINITVNMRSCDMALGFPNDFCFFSCLLIIIAKELNTNPGTICFFISNAHCYENQFVDILKYINTKIYDLPQMFYNGSINNLKYENFDLKNYTHGNHIKINITK